MILSLLQPKSFGCFWQVFRSVLEKYKNAIHQPRSVRIAKKRALFLEYGPRP